MPALWSDVMLVVVVDAGGGVDGGGDGGSGGGSGGGMEIGTRVY